MTDATNDELPGALALVRAVGTGSFPHTMDATKWGDEWAKTLATNPGLPHDQDAMVGWFANAIMAGYDTANHRAAAKSEPVGQSLMLTKVVNVRCIACDRSLVGVACCDRKCDEKGQACGLRPLLLAQVAP